MSPAMRFSKVASMPVLPEGAIGSRVLIVDDDPFALDMARALAHRLGLVVITGATGFDAIAQRFGIAPPKVIVMNLGMPEISGADATRQIRRREVDEGRPRVPIVLESSTSEGRLATIAAECGADGSVTRPWLPETWAEVVIRAGWPSRPG